jgi:hypothetical protein
MSFRNDRRQQERDKACLTAIAVEADGVIRHQGKMVSRSQSGATIELETEVQLPTRFVLLFGHVSEPCQLIWQRGHTAGVNFEDDRNL